MGTLIQFEEKAVASLRRKLGAAESANADLIAFARGHSGAVAAIHHAVLAAITQVNRLPGRLAQRIEAGRQVRESLIVVLFMFARQGVEFQAQFGPGDFLAALHAADVLAQQVAGDADQPRADRRRPAELLAPQVAAEKDFLAQILGIGRLDQPSPQKAIDRVLVQLDQGGKRSVVAALGRRD